VNPPSASDTNQRDDLDTFESMTPAIPPVIDVVIPRRSRRRVGGRLVAPRSHFVFRWVFPLIVAGLAVTTVLLGLDAKDLVLNSRDGTIARNITDPSAPGFSAEVVPTSTLLVLQTDEKNQLVSVVVMSLASADGGGTMLFFPSDLVVQPTATTSATLAKLYADASPEGEAAVSRVVTRLLDADVDSSITIGAATLEALIKPVAPVRYTLRDNVRAVQGGNTVILLKSGLVSITTADQIDAATEVLGPGEASINRFARQVDFWRAWLDQVSAASDKTAALPAFDSALVRFVRTLGSGTTSIEQAKFTEKAFNGFPLLVADAAGIKAIAQQMIPYPQEYEPGARLHVEVRNGVGDLARNEPMNRKIVLAGGQIVVLGNTEAFGVAESSVVFYSEDNRTRVEAFARQVGLPAPQFVDRPGSSIDLTVTIGGDFTP
jgi:hypothetical protein